MFHNVCRWGSVCAIVLVAACGPGLPKKATKDVADEVAKVSTAFQELEKASVDTTIDAWVVSVVRSGHPVRLNDSCGEAASVLPVVARKINKAANAAKPDPALLTKDWVDRAKELNDHAKDCALEVLNSRKRPTGRFLVPGFAQASYAGINVEFNKQFRILIKSLSLYYTALARAAAGEDIEKQEAAGNALAEAAGAVAGTASKALAMGADIGPLVTAVGKLAVKADKAQREAERYDAIQQALEVVSSEEMALIENALGWSVVYLQAKAMTNSLDDRAQFEVTVFNSWKTRDWVGSGTRLRSAVAATTAARGVASQRLTKGISELSELHSKLTEDIQRRDGNFKATFERLVAIAEAGNAVLEAAEKLKKSKE